MPDMDSDPRDYFPRPFSGCAEPRTESEPLSGLGVDDHLGDAVDPPA
jgi:hypothetical protein